MINETRPLIYRVEKICLSQKKLLFTAFIEVKDFSSQTESSMSFKCEICGKGSQFGHKVSHSNRKAAKRWRPNIQNVNIHSKTGGKKKMKVCTRCISAGKTLEVA